MSFDVHFSTGEIVVDVDNKRSHKFPGLCRQMADQPNYLLCIICMRIFVLFFLRISHRRVAGICTNAIGVGSLEKIAAFFYHDKLSCLLDCFQFTSCSA